MDKQSYKNTSLWLGISIGVLSLLYLFVTMGKAEWTIYIASISGIILSGTLLVQAHLLAWIRTKSYMHIGFGDFVVIGTTLFAVVIFMNSLLLIQQIGNIVPTYLFNFTKSVGITGAVGGIILGIINASYPRLAK